MIKDKGILKEKVVEDRHRMVKRNDQVILKETIYGMPVLIPHGRSGDQFGIGISG